MLGTNQQQQQQQKLKVNGLALSPMTELFCCDLRVNEAGMKGED